MEKKPCPSRFMDLMVGVAVGMVTAALLKTYFSPSETKIAPVPERPPEANYVMFGFSDERPESVYWYEIPLDRQIQLGNRNIWVQIEKR